MQDASTAPEDGCFFTSVFLFLFPLLYLRKTHSLFLPVFGTSRLFLLTQLRNAELNPLEIQFSRKTISAVDVRFLKISMMPKLRHTNRSIMVIASKLFVNIVPDVLLIVVYLVSYNKEFLRRSSGFSSKPSLHHRKVNSLRIVPTLSCTSRRDRKCILGVQIHPVRFSYDLHDSWMGVTTDVPNVLTNVMGGDRRRGSGAVSLRTLQLHKRTRLCA